MSFDKYISLNRSVSFAPDVLKFLDEESARLSLEEQRRYPRSELINTIVRKNDRYKRWESKNRERNNQSI